MLNQKINLIYIVGSEYLIENFICNFQNYSSSGEIVNQMMNDNWHDLFVKLQPRIEEEMSKRLLKIISDFFRDVPYNEIFPDV